MKKEDIIIFGAGGHGVSVLDILLSEYKYNIVAIADKNKQKESSYGIPIVEDSVAYSLGIRNAIVAIGDNTLRRKIFKNLQLSGFSLINAISRMAYVSSRAQLGCGVVVMPYAVVNIGAHIGNGTVINTRASVDHDTIVGDFCHVAPGSTLCGFVKVGNGAFVCAGSTVIDHISIGKDVIIGAGSTVIKNVSDRQTVVGVPAKPIKN